jgi:hypothetical protein
VELDVTPKISPDNKVLLRVTPQVSSTAPTNVSLGNNVTAVAINQQTVDTTVLCSDGETVAIGGLITRRDTKNENKIPWLGDLPGVGVLFRYRTQAKNKQELLIIMTPHIVRSRADADRILAEESRRMDWVLGDVMRTQGPSGLNPLFPPPPPGAGPGGPGVPPPGPGLPPPPSVVPGHPAVPELPDPAGVLPTPRTVPTAPAPQGPPLVPQMPPAQGYAPAPAAAPAPAVVPGPAAGAAPAAPTATVTAIQGAPPTAYGPAAAAPPSATITSVQAAPTSALPPQGMDASAPAADPGKEPERWRSFRKH